MFTGVMPKGKENEGLFQIISGYCPNCNQQVTFNTRFNTRGSIKNAVYICPNKDCHDSFLLETILKYQTSHQ
jgi:hypothetical protein